HPVHVTRRGCHAAEEIAASHYQADLHTGLGYFGNFFRQRLDARGVQPEGAFPSQHFSAQFKQNTLVSRRAFAAHRRRSLRGHLGYSPAACSAADISPTLKRTKRATEIFSPSLAILL